MSSEPVVRVGIVASDRIEVELHGSWRHNNEVLADCVVEFSAPVVDIERYLPLHPDATFTVRNVAIGIGFHWRRNQNQRFEGILEVRAGGADKVQVVNEVEVERYLLSVISSEMNANAPLEFLKAHAVISRSWLMAQIKGSLNKCHAVPAVDADEAVMWYDHSSHTDFHVCADDHCQRYQGLLNAAHPNVVEAVAATRHQVLVYDNEIVDARFSKCCGGITERFSTCWQPIDVPYLQARTDDADCQPADCSSEEDASRWILSTPEAFCANPSPQVLASILNDYDTERPHLYRWQETLSAEQLTSLLRQKLGMDFGGVVALQPLHRGPSGRIDRLLVKGTKRSYIIGKELEIRRALSATHLYSSAFVVEPGEHDEYGVPLRFTLRGAGWGHGVGLCQIGAAVMASEGYDYKQILQHYFVGAQIR